MVLSKYTIEYNLLPSYLNTEDVIKCIENLVEHEMLLFSWRWLKTTINLTAE